MQAVKQWLEELGVSQYAELFAAHQNPAFAIQASRAGAKGDVTKSSPPDVLIRAVYDVFNGRTTRSVFC